MPTQKHIHLSTTIGSAPENAPDLTWRVVAGGRKEVPEIIGNYTRGWRGHLILQQFQVDGAVAQLSNFSYILKIDANDGYDIETRSAQLKAMHGKIVYLCDHFHANDGADHTNDIKLMYCAVVGEFPPDYTALFRFEVQVDLVDARLIEKTVVDDTPDTIVDDYGRTIIV